MRSTDIDYTHPEYDNNKYRWEFFLRSYMGGEDYKDGGYLTRYVNEDKDEYNRRLDLTPLDNHCKNIVHIYSSFLWRVPPVRQFNSLANDQAVTSFMEDSDLDGRGFNAFMRQAQAEELAQDIRPYVTMFTPENVMDWKYERTASGRFKLVYLKVREAIEEISDTEKETYYRIWREDSIESWKSMNEVDTFIERMDNTLGKIPAVFLPAQRSVVRGVGISDLSDAAYMQKAIYQELSEIEQLIRISNHPTLVKTYNTDASAGAGSVINMPDDMDSNMKPYQMQPSGQNLDAVRAAIEDKVQSINRMSHMGAVRGTDAVTMSGVAMATEFQMLNAKLAEKADILELAEEQLWQLFAEWQEVTPDVEVFYPDAFDLRDYDKELVFLQQMRSSGVKSVTLMQEIDKQIADLVLDDENLAKAHVEIEASGQTLGLFTPEVIEPEA